MSSHRVGPSQLPSFGLPLSDQYMFDCFIVQYTGSIIFCLSFAFAGHSTGRYSVQIFQWLDETLTYAMWIISSSTVLRNTRSSSRLGIYSCYCGYDVVATLCESTDRPLSYHSLSTFKKFQSPAKYHRHVIFPIFYVPNLNQFFFSWWYIIDYTWYTFVHIWYLWTLNLSLELWVWSTWFIESIGGDSN